MDSTLRTCGCLIFAILLIYSPPAWRSTKQAMRGVSSVRFISDAIVYSPSEISIRGVNDTGRTAATSV